MDDMKNTPDRDVISPPSEYLMPTVIVPRRWDGPYIPEANAMIGGIVYTDFPGREPGSPIVVPRFPTMCICSSVRHVGDMGELCGMLHYAGWCVVPVSTIGDDRCRSAYLLTPKELRDIMIETLVAMHAQTILSSDAVYIYNKDGIGESVRAELEFARKHGKTIYFTYPDPLEGGVCDGYVPGRTR